MTNQNATNFVVHDRSFARGRVASCGISIVLAMVGCSKPLDSESSEPITATSGTGAPAASGQGGATGAAGDAPHAGAGGNAVGGAAAPQGGAPSAGASGAAAGSGGAGPADASVPVPDGAMPPADAGPATGPFPAVTDLQAGGPFTGATVQNSGPNGDYTIYHPAELAPGGARNPIVGWMSGGSTEPSLYTLLPHLATHGFVVVASNTVPAIGAEVELGQEIIAGIDWILAQNEDASSMFFEKLDASRIASMGYSMGALATTTIADDPRLTTTVHISGGNMVTERIAKLHAPAAFLCGENDIADPNCATDFTAATTPVFYGQFAEGDHLGVLFPPYADRIRAAVTGWLLWQLMADTTLETMFVGTDCTLCKDPNWTVQQKGF